MTLDTKLHVELIADYASALDLKSSNSRLAFVKQINLATGTGAGQADKVWDDERTIAPSGTDDLDLAGVLTDAFGAIATFVKVKGIFLYALPTNVNNVVIGGAAATQFVGPFGAATHTLAVRPGGLFALIAPDLVGYAVAAGASDLLRIANSGAGTSVVYDIVIVGTSA